MATDPNIALKTGTLDTATPIVNAQNQQHQNALMTEKILQSQYETMDAREKARLKSVAAAAAQLKPYLDKEDYDGAHEFLVRRRQQLQQRMGSGDNIDTEETDAAIDMIRRGNIDELKNNVHGVMAAASVYGILDGNNTPSSVKEWQYYNSLSPEDQQRWLQQKRANQLVDTGDTVKVIGPDGKPREEYNVNLKPGDEPGVRGDQAYAAEQGKIKATREGDTTKKEFDAQANMNYIREAQKLLPKATNGGIASVVKGGQQLAGVSTDASKADRKLAILSAKLVGTVPRFEGPQGVLDVQLYQEAAGDLANTSLPVEDRMAAAELMMDLMNEYGATGRGKQVSGGQQPSGQVQVFNPQTGEEFTIDASDLQAAQAEGFQQR